MHAMRQTRKNMHHSKTASSHVNGTLSSNNNIPLSKHFVKTTPTNKRRSNDGKAATILPITRPTQQTQRLRQTTAARTLVRYDGTQPTAKQSHTHGHQTADPVLHASIKRRGSTQLAKLIASNSADKTTAVWRTPPRRTLSRYEKPRGGCGQQLSLTPLSTLLFLSPL